MTAAVGGRNVGVGSGSDLIRSAGVPGLWPAALDVRVVPWLSSRAYLLRASSAQLAVRRGRRCGASTTRIASRRVRPAAILRS